MRDCVRWVTLFTMWTVGPLFLLTPHYTGTSILDTAPASRAQIQIHLSTSEQLLPPTAPWVPWCVCVCLNVCVCLCVCVCAYGGGGGYSEMRERRKAREKYIERDICIYREKYGFSVSSDWITVYLKLLMTRENPKENVPSGISCKYWGWDYANKQISQAKKKEFLDMIFSSLLCKWCLQWRSGQDCGYLVAKWMVRK